MRAWARILLIKLGDSLTKTRDGVFGWRHASTGVVVAQKREPPVL